MRPRVLWFVAGTAAGVYASIKARRAAYRLSVPGVVDQAAALGVGWRAFNAELHDGMEAEERRIVADLYGRAAPSIDTGAPALSQGERHDLPPAHEHDKDYT